MLEKISITNFKKLKDLSIEGFGRVNIICGSNNSGKTSILEAIYALTSMNRQINFGLVARGFLTRSPLQIGNNNIEVMKNLFYLFDFNLPILVKSNERELSIKYKAVNEPNYDAAIVSTTDSNLSTSDRNHVATMRGPDRSVSVEVRNLVNNDIASIEIYDTTLKIIPSDKVFHTLPCCMVSESTQIRRGESQQNQYGEMSSLISRNMETDVVNQGLKMFAYEFNSIAIAYNQIVIGHSDYPIKMPLSTFGTGLQRVLFIVASIMNSKDGIVLVDEIENGIHYSIMPKLWEVIFKLTQQYNCQLFVTTHSEEFMKYVMSDDKVWNENKQDFRCITLYTEKDGGIIPSILPGSEFENMTDRKIELRG